MRRQQARTTLTVTEVTTVIERIDDGIWSVTRPFRVIGVELGTRMTVVRLASGGLLLYSPVRLDDELRRAIDAIGPVEQILAPSKVHHLFAGDYVRAYPDSKLLAAPGLPEKRKDLSFDSVIDDAVPPAQWRGALQPVVLRGAPLMNEVMLVHAPSRSLLVTDVAFNLPRSGGWWTRTYLRLMKAYGGFAQSKMVKLSVRDRSAARQSIDRLLDKDFERVIVTHGAVFEQGGRAALESLFAWL